MNRFGLLMVLAMTGAIVVSLYGQVYGQALLALRATFCMLLMTLLLGIIGLKGGDR